MPCASTAYVRFPKLANPRYRAPRPAIAGHLLVNRRFFAVHLARLTFRSPFKMLRIFHCRAFALSSHKNSICLVQARHMCASLNSQIRAVALPALLSQGICSLIDAEKQISPSALLVFPLRLLYHTLLNVSKCCVDFADCTGGNREKGMVSLIFSCQQGICHGV